MQAGVAFMRIPQPGLVRQLPNAGPLLSPQEDEFILGPYPIGDPPGALFAGQHSVVVGHGSPELPTRLMLRTEHNFTVLDSPPESERLQQESKLLIDLVRRKRARLRIQPRIISGHIKPVPEARARSLLPRSAIRIQDQPMPIVRPELHAEVLDALCIPEEQTAGIDHMMEHMVLVAVKVRIEPDGDLPRFMEWEPRRQFRTAPLRIIGGGTVGAFLALVQAAVDLDDEGAAVEDRRRFVVDLPVDGENGWVVAMAGTAFPMLSVFECSESRELDTVSCKTLQQVECSPTLIVSSVGRQYPMI